MVKLAEDDPQVAGVFGRHEAYENATFFTKRCDFFDIISMSSGPKVIKEKFAKRETPKSYNNYTEPTMKA